MCFFSSCKSLSVPSKAVTNQNILAYSSRFQSFRTKISIQFCGLKDAMEKYSHNDNIIWHSLRRIDKWPMSVRNKYYPAIEKKQIASISTLTIFLSPVYSHNSLFIFSSLHSKQLAHQTHCIRNAQFYASARLLRIFIAQVYH